MRFMRTMVGQRVSDGFARRKFPVLDTIYSPSKIEPLDIHLIFELVPIRIS